MRFIVDAHLPIALARHIRAKGHTATHVFDIGLADAEDSPMWQRVVDHDEIIITKDEDFAVRRSLSSRGPAIVWRRIGNASNRALTLWLDPVWDGIIFRLSAGDTLIEVT